MATSNAPEQLSLLADEFLLVQDDAFGRDVSAMVDGEIPLQSADGFSLLKRSMVQNLEIAEAMRTYLRCEEKDTLGLGLYRILGPVPGAYAFRRSYVNQIAESVLLHLFSRGSKIRLWKGTNRTCIAVTQRNGDLPLWRAELSEIQAAGLQSVERSLDHGGWCLRDPRVFMEILSGKAFTVAVAKVPLPAEWGIIRTIAFDEFRTGTGTRLIEELVCCFLDPSAWGYHIMGYFSDDEEDLKAVLIAVASANQ
ncbi:hypothetical protein PWT90_09957 [Aphanocladium album]|nr:hypothetical protein PWT90_09957 [Aphanocladium album]